MVHCRPHGSCSCHERNSDKEQVNPYIREMDSTLHSQRSHQHTFQNAGLEHGGQTLLPPCRTCNERQQLCWVQGRCGQTWCRTARNLLFYRDAEAVAPDLGADAESCFVCCPTKSMSQPGLWQATLSCPKPV